MPGFHWSPGFFVFLMCDDFTPRLKASDLQKLAAKRLQELQADGEELHPVVNTTRKLATHFWGAAWMKQLALCESGGMCLAPGRTLLRHGCVLDLTITTCCIRAKVSTDELYDIELHLKALDDEKQSELAAACCGHIDSLMALLNGKVDSAVLQHLCHPENGLLPSPEDWTMSCSCPDWAEPCPHAAAAIYAAGCLIDADPGLLFTLRGINPEALLQSPEQPVHIDTAALSATFGIDLDLI